MLCRLILLILLGEGSAFRLAHNHNKHRARSNSSRKTLYSNASNITYSQHPILEPSADDFANDSVVGVQTTSGWLRHNPPLYRTYGNHGGSGGSDFDHWNDYGLAGGIVEICVWSGNMVDAIEVNYAGHKQKFGGGGGSKQCFPLKSNEHITQVKTRTGWGLDAIEFKTNKGRTSKYFGGGGGDHEETWFNEKDWNGYHLMGFYGKAAGMIDRIGFYFGRGGGVASWKQMQSCHGCGQFDYEFEVCSERAGSETKETAKEWSVGVSNEMSAGFEYKGLSATRTVAVTSSYSQSVVQTNQQSFKDTRCLKTTFSCAKKYLWQWTFDSNFDGKGNSLTVTAPLVCSNERPCCMPGTFSSSPRNCDLDPKAPKAC